MRPELYEILGDFEQFGNLEEYVSKLEKENNGLDKGYFDGIKKNNKEVSEHFRKLGEGGIKYLKQTINLPEISIREKSIHILGYIANNNKKYLTQIKNILRGRKEIENEKNVLERIVYSLSKIERL
jgi:hypothetical protein